MEFLNYFQTTFGIDPVIVLLVLASGFFQKRYLSSVKVNEALKTLLVSFLVVSIYWALLGFSTALLKGFFLSYFFATSFYELIFQPIIKWIQSKLPKDENAPEHVEVVEVTAKKDEKTVVVIENKD